jgi:hypothetical protein
MVKFGDIEIPWVTNKDSSISRDIIEKNFNEYPPQVYELKSDLESGNFSIILNETVQNKNEQFHVQEDAVLSMVSRHGTEFPFNDINDSGYIVVNSASVNNFPSEEIRQGEIGIKFLNDTDYRSAIDLKPQFYIYGAYSPEPVETIHALPSDIDVINETPDYQISASDGNMDVYIISSEKIIEYDEYQNDKTLSQTQSICRAYNSSDERVYSDRRVMEPDGSYVDNALFRITSNSSNSLIEYYDGSWISFGTSNVNFSSAYTFENSNDTITVEDIDEDRFSLYRGFSAVKYEFTGESSFDITTTNNVSLNDSDDYYSHYIDSNNSNEFLIIKTESKGDFYNNASDIGISNLDSSERYTIFVSYVPDSISYADYARYIYNMGKRERTFVQK